MILEVAADMEAMFGQLCAEGVPEGEAALRTEQLLAVSSDAVRALVEVHTSSFDRWLSRGAWAVRSAVDVLLFAAGVVPLLLVSGLVVTTQIQQGQVGGPFFWLVLLMATGVLVLSGTRTVRVVFRRGLPLERLRAGLPTLLYLGGLTALIGGVGFLLTVYTAAMGLAGFGEVTDPMRAAETIMAAGTAFTIALLVWIAAGLIWMVLSNRIATLEQAEAEALLAC